MQTGMFPAVSAIRRLQAIFNWIAGLPADTSPDRLTDSVAFFDASAGVAKRLLLRYLAGIDHIQTQTAAAAASIDFTSIDAANYAGYLLLGRNIQPGTDAVNLLLRVSIAGTFAAANYSDSAWRVTAAAASAASGATTDTGIPINSTLEVLGNAANEKISFAMFFPNCADTADYKKAAHMASYLSAVPTWMSLFGTGQYIGATSALDGFRLIMDSGTISGTATLLGIRGS